MKCLDINTILLCILIGLMIYNKFTSGSIEGFTDEEEHLLKRLLDEVKTEIRGMRSEGVVDNVTTGMVTTGMVTTGKAEGVVQDNVVTTGNQCMKTDKTYKQGARCKGSKDRKTPNWCCSAYGKKKGYEWILPSNN